MIVDAQMVFHSCLQTIQEVGSDDECMVSRVFFSIVFPDKTLNGLHVDIKQTAGDKYEGGSIEVGPPQGITKGYPNYQDFRDSVEKYYRSLVGSSGQAIKIQNSRNVLMKNNRLVKSMTVDIKFDPDAGGQ